MTDDQLDDSEINNYICMIKNVIYTKYKIEDEDSINKAIEDVRQIFNYSDGVVELIKRRIKMTLGHKLDMGTMIMEEHKAWYMARTKESKMICTERNRKYLLTERHLSSDIVTKLGGVTDEIMDGFGDPRFTSFKRRGLVMGDVQSGKTNTYTMLSCKAADVGYKMIILLTGTLEILRRQTQARLDEGLVGSDSAIALGKGAKKSVPIGVGRINPDFQFGVFTSTKNDFKASIASQLNLPVANLEHPMLLVVKKNKSILNNLHSWLQNNSMHGFIESPLLLIDDEADNASINTSRNNVTAINQSIRDILSLFKKSTYVGFTATPYANIFIDPDADEDLYPSDFIYCLNSPSNYVSPKSIYQAEGSHRYMLKTIEIDDNVDENKKGLPELPYKHSKDFKMTHMPQSLKEAINCFIISCTIRDLRNQCNSHMSMLVNASRFTDVQESIKDLIENYIFNIKADIEIHSKLPEPEAMHNEYIKSLKSTWLDNYQDTGYNWMSIQLKLQSSLMPITVRSVNQKNGPKNLNYSDNPDGLRIIAVGGNSLSRGLTLEGLCISYFYRRSENYDTLMQMGRWFGYREGYNDLCRVWMTAESIDWYDGISNATEELKREFILMHNLNKTPRDFGFRVRSDINGLIITARNKMIHTGDDYIYKSLNGRMVWTSSIHIDKENILTNKEILLQTIDDLNKYTKPFMNSLTNNYVWPKVPNKNIIDFIEKFKFPEKENILLDRDAIVATISNQDIFWDVSIVHGEGKIYQPLAEKFGMEIRTVNRTKYTYKEDCSMIRINSSGLVTPSHLREGIYALDKNGEDILVTDELCEESHPIPDEDEINRLRSLFDDRKKREAELNGTEYSIDEKKSGKYPATTYLASDKRRPLMLIYPLDLKPKSGDEHYESKNIMYNALDNECPLGILLGFPMYEVDPNDINSDKLLIKYKTNVIYNKMGGNDDLDLDEDE